MNASIEILFSKYYDPLCLFAHRYVKDIEQCRDIVSDAFIKVWEKNIYLDSEKSPRSFLYSVVYNSCIDYLRSEKVKQCRVGDYKVAESEGSILNNIIYAETIVSLHRTINLLPKECRKVFKLMYIEGKGIREIADELHISTSTVKNQRMNGLRLIKSKIK